MDKDRIAGSAKESAGKVKSDLNKKPVISPYTGEVVPIAPPPRTRADASAQATPKPAEAEENTGKVKAVVPESEDDIETAVGDITGDAKTQALGRAREASGSVHNNLYGQAKEAFDAALEERKIRKSERALPPPVSAYDVVHGIIRDGSETMVFEVENDLLGASRGENGDGVLHEIKSEVLRLVGANLLDGPEAHLAYIRGRLKSVA